ncbi:MAG: hypothetical protein D6788_09140 [Planctomycetota bacterium]|nr:MAG: hypothetical protein D6788_09140 [Planctomycetota bacterium]
MHGDVLIVGLLLVFGCVAFLFGLVYLAVQLLLGVGRAIGRLFGGRPPLAETPPPVRRVCPNRECRWAESRPEAAFCPRCGTPLRPAFDEPLSPV